jgi:outer membrane protein TolC
MRYWRPNKRLAFHLPRKEKCEKCRLESLELNQRACSELAEAHNPETRLAWERARAQAAALGIARSELYPTLVAAALSGVTRSQTYQ